MEKSGADHTFKRALVLLIGAIDSGGGAGIGADAISVYDTGGFALLCPTALTAQSLKTVQEVCAVSQDFFKLTLNTLLRDFPGVHQDHPLDTLKISLITDEKILNLLDLELKEGGALNRFTKIVDPILKTTKGKLLGQVPKDLLLKLKNEAILITPNAHEALALLGALNEDALCLKDPSDAKEAVSLYRALLLNRFGLDKTISPDFKESSGLGELLHPKAALLIKSVSQTEDGICDLLLSRRFGCLMEQKKLAGDGVHGGGCALSSALASLTAQGLSPEDAAVLASSYVAKGQRQPALKAPFVLLDQKLRPPVGHFSLIDEEGLGNFDLSFMPRIIEPNFPKNSGPFAPCPQQLGLYPVLDNLALLKTAVLAGVRTVQLRIKDPHHPKLRQMVREARDFCVKAKARLFIDDYWQLAIEEGVYGVHLGMEDLRIADLKAIKQSHLRLGVSTHGIFELLKAIALSPSYIALGHIFPTQTKQMPSKPQGMAMLLSQLSMLQTDVIEEVHELNPTFLTAKAIEVLENMESHGYLIDPMLSAIPTVAIGGIKEHHMAKLMGNCALGSCAVVTAITKASDPKATIKKLLKIVGSGPEESYK